MTTPSSTHAPRVLIALPDIDFDPTESAIPWLRMQEAGMEITFATSTGGIAAADPLLISGVLFGKIRATEPARATYAAMVASHAFTHPVSYEAIQPGDFDAIVLPGGHAPGMKPYLESRLLQSRVQQAMANGSIVGAICHGVLLLARVTDPATGASMLRDRQVTALPKYMERAAWLGTAWKLGTYYRTYPTWVADEVRSGLAKQSQFTNGPGPWKPFALRDGNLVTSRWPKDSEHFASVMIEAIRERAGATSSTPTSAR